MLSGKPTEAVLSNTLLNFIPFYFVYVFLGCYFIYFNLLPQTKTTQLMF